MSELVTYLRSIQITDEYLDLIGAGITMTDLPKAVHDELVGILIGWRDEGRHDERGIL